MLSVVFSKTAHSIRRSETLYHKRRAKSSKSRLQKQLIFLQLKIDDVKLIFLFICLSQLKTTLADFAVLLAVVICTGVDAAFGLNTPKLNVPAEFKPTRLDR